MYQVVAPQSYDVTGWSYHSRGLKPGHPSAIPGAAQPVSGIGSCSSPGTRQRRTGNLARAATMTLAGPCRVPCFMTRPDTGMS